MSQLLPRRTLLRGAGAALALPLLEAMLPGKASAAEAAKPPVRMCFYITGGGAYIPYWSIDDSGRREELGRPQSVEYRAVPQERDEPLGALSPTLEPLDPHKI